ncbi:hypothetical protein [Caballeronia glebae]|uniref:hypothetical protein n=1 Tax=Caballeronia glebae TaxID=1777143 RepID=UPI002E107D66
MLSPLRSSTYAIRSDRTESSRIAFTATADASAHTLYWFVDGAFVGGVAPRATLFWEPPATGDYVVRVVDDQGRNDTRALKVTHAQ